MIIDKYEEKAAKDNITNFIRELIYKTENREIKWNCMNCDLKNYVLSAIRQSSGVVKYHLIHNKKGIGSVYISVSNEDYNLEVEFADEREVIYEIPLDDEHKNLLEMLIKLFSEQMHISTIKKINSVFPKFIQSSSDE